MIFLYTHPESSPLLTQERRRRRRRHVCLYNVFIFFLYGVGCSELVEVVIEGGDTFLETLSLSDFANDLVSLGAGIEGGSGDFGPMVEHTLGEGLSLSETSKMGGETEGL